MCTRHDVKIVMCAQHIYVASYMSYDDICAHSWNRDQYRCHQHAVFCYMIHHIPVDLSNISIRLWCVLVCVLSIAPTCVYAIQASIVVVHVNAPHHT